MIFCAATAAAQTRQDDLEQLGSHVSAVDQKNCALKKRSLDMFQR